MAATTEYKYDALGRLRKVTHDNGFVTDYTLDPAGNRSAVTDVPPWPTSAPSSISVPASSPTGSYSISWGTASGTVLSYELYESASSGFSPQTLVYSGAGLSTSIGGKPNGNTFYYRVRACAGATCSGYTAGANGVDIPLPSAPSSITVPPNSSFSNYVVGWGASSGVVSLYELYESTSSSFSSQTLAYSGTNLSASITGKTNGTYYYRVRACGAPSCGGYTSGANGIVVNIPPPAPPAPTNLSKTFVANCSWRANWDVVSTATSYVVRDTRGSEQTVTANQAYVTCDFNNQNSNKPKWVKACSSAGCSTTAAFP